MARIFISYSRADAQFISDLVPLLHEAYGIASVFYDEQIPGGTKWWEMILREIASCDLFVYLCSNESLQSPYCQSELREAVRLQKQILPVIVRPKTNYPYAGIDHGSAIPDDIAVILRDTNCIDLSRGFRDRELGPKAAARLYGAINKALDASSSGQPPPLTPYPTAQPQVNDKKKRSWLNEPRAIIVAAMITGVFALIAVIIPVIINGQNSSQTQETPTITSSPPPTTQVVAAAATALGSETPNPTISPSNTDELTDTASPSSTLSPTQSVNEHHVTVDRETVNLRSGPGTVYSTVGYEAQGTSLALIAQAYDVHNQIWYLVSIDDGNEAWILSSLVTSDAIDEQIPMASTIPSPPSSCEAGEMRIVTQASTTLFFGAQGASLSVSGSAIGSLQYRLSIMGQLPNSGTEVLLTIESAAGSVTANNVILPRTGSYFLHVEPVEPNQGGWVQLRWFCA